MTDAVLWEPEITGEYPVAGITVYWTRANREMSRDKPECIGEHVIIKGRRMVITAVERYLPMTPIREGEDIGIVVEPA